MPVIINEIDILDEPSASFNVDPAASSARQPAIAVRDEVIARVVSDLTRRHRRLQAD
jgi:hypothetical protein